ncbi:MAG: N(5)-(carboxyethyl)ornithine synthase [Acidobacteria bacterium]|nr:N(5)-(carboxyethyl)ornithine synthase [Acidobacteriota bacterium]
MEFDVVTLSMGVVGTSRKENESRVAIHPRHIEWIDPKLRRQIWFERGYGEKFSVQDEDLLKMGVHLATRDELMERCDVILNPKPVVDDLKAMRPGTVLWGWPHCVQQRQMTQIAIDRKLTLIAWEAMFTWSGQQQKLMHIFYKNNEMAGYCGVLDALRLTGLDGHYGPRKKAVVLSFGSVSRGAICALQGRGFHDIDIYTKRPPYSVADQVPGLTFRQLTYDKEGHLLGLRVDGKHQRFSEVLSQADIIVNGTLQDTDNPTDFLTEDEVSLLRKDTLIIDISCDEAMGFPFARPTTIEEPTFVVRDNITYYAVDHTPTYLWNAASWVISKSIHPFIGHVMEGPKSWSDNVTIDRSIEIRGGQIQNPKILSFQNRSPEYPHHTL